MTIDRERGRYRAGAAIIAAWNRVGVNLQVLDIRIVDSILSTGVVPSGKRAIGFERAITAARVCRAHLERNDGPVAHDAGPDRNHRRMRRIAC